jgi:steroid delta-isomerase-like uncharacterized protein
LSPKELVEQFYSAIWNEGDEKAAYRLLDPDFVFRGSLGVDRRGIEGFLDYVRSIRAALADYKCVIEDLVVADDRAAARMTFSGRHQGRLLGAEPTGGFVSWAGAAFFKTKDGRIFDLWVLGDLDALKRQLRG